MGISYVEYLANPKYRKYPFNGLIGWILANRPPSVEDLQSKYEFRYYSTMNKAVTDVNNGTTANADAEKGTAVAGVYTDENGGKNVVLLKDHTENAKITVAADMEINLGGHILTFENTYLGLDCKKDISITLAIDGRLSGSTMVLNGIDGGGYLIRSRTSTVVINGGTYRINETVYNPDYGAYVLFVSVGGTAIISDCVFQANGGDADVNGIYNGGTATISNCNILAFSDYLRGDSNSYFEAASLGVFNKGNLTINNSYIMGTHSGVENTGTLHVNGGTYEGYGHGGFYFSGTGTTAHVRDAIIRDCDMPDGYTATATRNGAGFYVGGQANEKVYMDNCNIYGTAASQIFVLKTNGNALYISNSTINNQNGGAANVRIDSGNTLYLGRGNNFTAENTSLPEAVVVTDEVYREVA